MIPLQPYRGSFHRGSVKRDLNKILLFNRRPEIPVMVPPPGKTVQPCLNLINKLGRIHWHAEIKPAYEHANGVFKYVGRYIRRGPI